jgi:predicted RNA-binding Zn-ribbon protein involved in translation (DUF1610 family)
MSVDLQTIVLASLLAWASGIRLYLVVFVAGAAAYLGYIELPVGLRVLQHPWVIGAAGIMLLLEFLVDKVPGVDSIWDALHTFIRIPAGALLAAGATGDGLSALTVAAGLLGGTITAGTHFAKAGSRAIINASPEPLSNWTASFAEDGMALAGIWLAFQFPVVFLTALAVFVALVIWLLPRLWRGIAGMWRLLRTRTGIGRATRRAPNPPSTWAEYKWQRNRFLLICFGGFLAAALVGMIVPAAFPIFLIAWFAGSVWSSMTLSYFKCPACGKPFIIRESGGHNGFTSKCLNCGLAKWSGPA